MRGPQLRTESDPWPEQERSFGFAADGVAFRKESVMAQRSVGCPSTTSVPARRRIPIPALVVALAASVAAGLVPGAPVSRASAAPRPDLVPTFQSVSPTTVLAGGQVVASVRVSNVGWVGTKATELRFSLVASNGSSTELWTSYVKSISANRSVSIMQSLTIPATLSPGDYRLIATADAPNVNKEVNELNNST